MSSEEKRDHSSSTHAVSAEVLSSLIAFGLGWLLRGNQRPSSTKLTKVRRSDPAPSVVTTSSVILRVTGAEVFEGDGVAASEQEELLIDQVIRAVAAHRASVQRLQSLKSQSADSKAPSVVDAAVHGTAQDAEQAVKQDGVLSASAETGEPALERTDASTVVELSEQERIWSEELAAVLKQRRPLKQKPARWCRTPDDFIAMLLHACVFAARKHRNHRRKDTERTPYINHALNVAYALWHDGRVRDGRVILAGILCHAISDEHFAAHTENALTQEALPDDLDENQDGKLLLTAANASSASSASIVEIEKEFGIEISSIVRECWAEKRVLSRHLAEKTVQHPLDQRARLQNDFLTEKKSTNMLHEESTARATGASTERSLWTRLFSRAQPNDVKGSDSAAQGQTPGSEKGLSNMWGRAKDWRVMKASSMLTRMDRKKIEAACSMLKSKEAKMVRLADKLVNLREILACEQGRPHGWSQQRTAEYFAWADALQRRIGNACPPLAKAIEKIVKMHRSQYDLEKNLSREPALVIATGIQKSHNDGEASILSSSTEDEHSSGKEGLFGLSPSNPLDKENFAVVRGAPFRVGALAPDGGQQHQKYVLISDYLEKHVSKPLKSSTIEADTSSLTISTLDTPAKRGVLLELQSTESL